MAPGIPAVTASSADPDIREIILGSEGRMGIITEVKVRVTPLRPNPFTLPLPRIGTLRWNLSGG